MLRPPRVTIYGPHGVGKNTWASSAPAPVLLDIEDGQPSGLDVPSFRITSFGELMEALSALYTEEHSYQTVIIDSLDWLEPMIWAETVRRNNAANPNKAWGSIEDAGYGKGYIAALDPWREVLDGTNALRNDRSMAIIFTAHADVKRFDSPEVEPFDRYQIKLQKLASALVQEHCDDVLFANYKTSITKADVGGKSVNRGVGGGTRVLYTEERPAFLAKNRHQLPPELPLAWAAFSEAMQASAKPAV
ncbi:ATP-binding protein [Sphingomonas sp. ac-8]|uniref:ATP-binding protein n=1 Tax=Sphingomonas sp. ac-8 TaxID=3242977 RepID=UPI003A7FB636